MKRLFTALFLLVTISVFSQTDTVMMNNRFLTQDPSTQKYELSSLKNYTTACNISFISGVIGTGCFVAAALIPDIESQSKAMFMLCGTVGLGFSIGYHISSINIIDNPTIIVPVKP